MEIHAHTHTPRKKWTHYFWEFIMLFLAVFAGFLAENKREHIVEHKRERQYMVSMFADLHTDRARLNGVMKFIDKQLKNYDSLCKLLKAPLNSDNMGKVYYYFLPTTSYDLFNPSRRTIDQLEHSGGMRLIKNQNVSDSITDYYILATAAVGQGTGWLRYFDQYHELAFRVFDYAQIDTVFYEREKILASPAKFSLLANEPVIIRTLYNKLFALRFILANYVLYLEELLVKATSTLAFLKAEYHLE